MVAPPTGWTREAFEKAAPKLADAVFLVEADEEAIGLLRLTRGPQASQDWRRADWAPWDGSQEVARVGELGGEPVDALLRREIVNGAPVCFYSIASNRGHWEMVEAFLKIAFAGVESCDANNFGQFLNQSQALAAKAQAKAISNEARLVGAGKKRSL